MKTTTTTTLLLCFITLSLSAFAGKVVEHTTFHENLERRYNVYLPDSWSPGKKLPLVVALHAFKNPLKLYMATSQLKPHAERNSYIIAYPAAATGIWNNGHLPEEKPYDDMGFIVKMLAEIEDQYGYNYKRVYSLGYSSGGFMSFRLAAEQQNIFAASAIIGGALSVPISPATTAPIPLIQFHGLKDTVVPLYGKKGLIGSEGAINSLQRWLPVNKIEKRAIRSIGLLDVNGWKRGLAYIKYAFEPESDGAPIDFYVLLRAGHNLPLRLQIHPNTEIFKFFGRFELDKKYHKPEQPKDAKKVRSKYLVKDLNYAAKGVEFEEPLTETEEERQMIQQFPELTELMLQPGPIEPKPNQPTPIPLEGLPHPSKELNNNGPAPLPVPIAKPGWAHFH